MIEFIRGLPKAELHLHIEGTLEPQMAFDLAKRNGVALPYANVEALTQAYNFSDLQSFLNLYYACMDVLRRSEDFADLASAYLQRAAADGVQHVEMFFDPQAHVNRGIPLRVVIEGLSSAASAARERYGISVLLIACFLRDRPATEAMSTLEALAEHRDAIHGVGLDSAELGHPPSDFAEVFAAAGEMGLHRVAHAGEEGPPDYIWQALDVLGVERVDHGIRAAEDPALLRRLAVDKIPLTVCPLSNVRLKCVENLSDHPLPALLDAGVVVTVNSDDPAYFGGYVVDNYVALQRAFDLDTATLEQLARNSLDASFRGDVRGS
ncbi:adenosine deaminase [Tomitella biformata]|uniref:adenosine deaminase n=1 Tax=Tomitella biformata TaxID=630403 RepID=UPI0004B22369|nr:adenosine deaminase [Tomitella biformata]